ncbi:hypothetical protein L6452_21787 [Arctium lappa]|uniref:Uncharacterized protein n=1 Tax=Arctium lappa TaxID=4217 RepID=A0ACB9AXE4_ARCLA|nr:hypothetical protein L6452_21787 [Arctium lappa]
MFIRLYSSMLPGVRDEDVESFNSYFTKMPWLAVPFTDSETQEALDEQRIKHIKEQEEEARGNQCLMSTGAIERPSVQLRKKLEGIRLHVELL